MVLRNPGPGLYDPEVTPSDYDSVVARVDSIGAGFVQFGFGALDSTDVRSYAMELESITKGEFPEDAPISHWRIMISDGVQQANPTDYIGYFTSPGFDVAQFGWTHTGLNPSPNDSVNFQARFAPHLARISALAAKFANEPKTLIDEYNQFRALVFLSSWFNKIGWEDGR
jgi:hypothetical protein